MAMVPGVSVLADTASDAAEQLGTSVSTFYADMDGGVSIRRASPGGFDPAW